MHLATVEGSSQVTSIVLPIALVPVGLALIVVGYLSLFERLPRNRFAGVRTSATLRSDPVFRLANRVAAPTTLAAGAVLILAGGLAPLVGHLVASMVVVFVAMGTTVVLAVTGGRRGHQVAKAFNAQQPPAGGCGGCACGAGGCAGAAQAAENAPLAEN